MISLKKSVATLLLSNWTPQMWPLPRANRPKGRDAELRGYRVEHHPDAMLAGSPAPDYPPVFRGDRQAGGFMALERPG